MADFKKLIALITDEVEKFTAGIPGIQEKMQEDIDMLTRQLDLKGKSIAVTGKNIALLSKLKTKLQGVILNDAYKKSVKQLLTNFDKIVSLQNEYFLEVESQFKPPAIQKEITKQAIEAVANQLTENGLAANVTDKVYELLRKATTSGSLMKSLNDQLKEFVVNTDNGEGQLVKYTKQIANDSLNQFSGAYTQLISADLGFEWFRYSGANIETTRPFCLACTQRKWFHISELPKVLKGQFPEFKEFDGTIDPKTKLPRGMIPGTDISNFQVNRGGWNCQHQWRPGSEDIVPADIKNTVFATPEYKSWASLNGKKIN
jgi:hypothetical protein